jgi:sugar lactone lactonase YvrE
VLALILASACSATPGSVGGSTTVRPSTVSSSAGAGPSAAVASAPAVTVAPPSQDPGPTPIVIPKAALEPALRTAWTAKVDTSDSPWVAEPVVGPKGEIWAPLTNTGEIAIVTKDGAAAGTWGTPGTEPGQFTFIAGGAGYGSMAFRSDGGFVVADSGNQRIEQFDKNRAFVRAWGEFGMTEGKLRAPFDVAVDAQNRVHVMCDYRYDVQVFDEDGTFRSVLATRVGPYFALDRDGTIYATVDDAFPGVEVFAADGTWTQTWDLHNVMGFATDIVVTPSGRIFVASSSGGGSAPDYENLVELDRTGGLVHLWPNGAEGIAVNAAEDRLYEAFSDQSRDLVALELPGS